MNDIDKWTAEQCNIPYSNFDEMYKYAGREWTIEDPRCREIFRNWWIGQDVNNAVVFENGSVSYFRDYYYGQGDPFTGENEERCITAIYEASKK